ncbi:MAG: hypothetical protein ACXAD7_00545, partial [Candidatus Kariarchaeaceae archaeon]
NLVGIALADGKITQDEYKLISNFLKDVEGYTVLLDEAMDDGVISHYEKQKLLTQRTKIYNKIQHLAKEDLVVSEDEENLIKSIKKIVHDMHKLET